MAEDLEERYERIAATLQVAVNGDSAERLAAMKALVPETAWLLQKLAAVYDVAHRDPDLTLHRSWPMGETYISASRVLSALGIEHAPVAYASGPIAGLALTPTTDTKINIGFAVDTDR